MDRLLESFLRVSLNSSTDLDLDELLNLTSIARPQRRSSMTHECQFLREQHRSMNLFHNDV